MNDYIYLWIISIMLVPVILTLWPVWRGDNNLPAGAAFIAVFLGISFFLIGLAALTFLGS